MPKAEIEEVVDVTPEQFFKAISAFEDYPKFVDGVKKVKILKHDGNKFRVAYVFSIMFKDIGYTLDQVVDAKALKVEWTLVESEVFSSNSGKWTIQASGKNKAKVKYELEGEFKIAVPDMVVNKLLKSSMPGLVKAMEKRAKSL